SAGVTERLVVPLKPGNAGGGKEPQLKVSAGRDEEPEIGDEPNTSTKCSEVAGGAACQSEGIARLPFLRPIRQGVPQRRSDVRLRLLPCQQGSGRRGRADVRGHRSIRVGSVAGRTDAGTEE